MTIEDIFRGLYKTCECGCGELMPIIDKQGRIRRFKKGHQPKGSDHFNWRGGRKKNRDYWLLLIPDYYRANKRGYVPEHIYFYEQYNKCCVLPWGNVHHIDPVTKTYCNNMPWNLQGMMKGRHMALHKIGVHKDTSYIKCYSCNSNKTYITKPSGKRRNKTPFPQWLHLPWDKENWYCKSCYGRLCKLYKKSKSFLNLKKTHRSSLLV